MIFANLYLNDKYYLSSKCDIFAKIYGREEMVSIPYNKLSAIIILFPAKNKKNKDNEVINIEWYGWCVLSCIE